MKGIRVAFLILLAIPLVFCGYEHENFQSTRWHTTGSVLQTKKEKPVRSYDAGYSSRVPATVSNNDGLQKESLPAQEEADLNTTVLSEDVTSLETKDAAISEEVAVPEETTETELPESEEQEKISSIAKEVVQPDGNVKEKFVTMTREYFSLLPEGLQKLLADKGVRILVTDKNIAQEFEGGRYKSMQGITFHGQNLIYIEDREVACREATLHECGHLLDEYLSFVSFSDEFGSVYQKERGGIAELADEYCASEAGEYFAELFSQYFRDGDKVHEKCPESCAYLENALKKLEEA